MAQRTNGSGVSRQRETAEPRHTMYYYDFSTTAGQLALYRCNTKHELNDYISFAVAMRTAQHYPLFLLLLFLIGMNCRMAELKLLLMLNCRNVSNIYRAIKNQKTHTKMQSTDTVTTTDVA